MSVHLQDKEGFGKLCGDWALRHSRRLRVEAYGEAPCEDDRVCAPTVHRIAAAAVLAYEMCALVSGQEPEAPE